MSAPPSSDCIFCRILRGEIPCHRVYQDDQLLAFLDISPVTAGHVVVVPRHHAERLEDLPAEPAAALGRTLGRLGRAASQAVGADAYNVLQNNGPAAGQLVPHVHFHLIPRRAGDKLGYRWPQAAATPAQLAALAAQIQAAL